MTPEEFDELEKLFIYGDDYLVSNQNPKRVIASMLEMIGIGIARADSYMIQTKGSSDVMVKQYYSVINDGFGIVWRMDEFKIIDKNSVNFIWIESGKFRFRSEKDFVLAKLICYE